MRIPALSTDLSDAEFIFPDGQSFMEEWEGFKFRSNHSYDKIG